MSLDSSNKGPIHVKKMIVYTALFFFVVCVMYQENAWRSSLALPQPVVEAGYSQGGVVSGAIFQGTPYRTFNGKRLFTEGWENRVGKTPLGWEKISTLTSNQKVSSKECSKWGVVTTIFEPSDAIIDAANFGEGWCIVIVGDRKTPANFMTTELRSNDAVFYFGVSEQEAWARLPGEVGQFVRAVSPACCIYCIQW